MHKTRVGTSGRVWLFLATVGTMAWMWGNATTAGSAAVTAAQAGSGTLRWYKGNTHTHTLNSDGDSTPDDVVRWYREHGYQFLVLTDHNFLTSVDGLNALHGADEKFLVVKGEEVTSSFKDASRSASIHVNGLNVSSRVEPARNAASVLETIQRNVDGIRAANGVPHINHPNFGWSLTPDDLRQVRNNRLFEVYNGHPTVHNEGGGGVPSLEEAWDMVLSQGVRLYGVAVDDAHTFKQPGNPAVAGPGRGWIVVRASGLEAGALLDAVERGDFYASTGVSLDDIQSTRQSMTVKIRQQGDFKYRTQFLGKGGTLLTETTDLSSTYTFTGSEGYVRAKVIDSGGRSAWIQPVFISQ